MKRIFDEEIIAARMKENPYCEFLQDLKLPVFLIECFFKVQFVLCHDSIHKRDTADNHLPVFVP